jgi:hypothetical protein
VTLTPQLTDDVTRSFATHGYAIVPNVVSQARLACLREQLLQEFARAKEARKLFSGGGMLSGHLNCFPGADSRFVLDTLLDAGFIDLVRQLSPQAVRLPNIGCNLNLPGSSAQNFHVDSYASEPFMILNVAAVDTYLVNGAMEVSVGTHLRDYKYWEFALARRPLVRISMSAGDVLIRSSSLWHRGMPNRSQSTRPMLGFTWEEGGSELEDPYSAHGGRIRFLYNRYAPDLSGRLREQAFAALPRLGSGYLFVRSLLRGRT